MPTLTRPGLFALGSLVALSLAAGLTGHPLLAVAATLLGTMMLGSFAALSLLLFELRRERLEFTWRLAGDRRVLAGGHVDVELSFRNLSPFAWRGVGIEPVGSPALVAARDVTMDLSRRASATALLRFLTPRAGHWVAHGTVLRFQDAAGFFEMAPYCPRRLVIRVRPSSAAGSLRLARPAAAHGQRVRRQRGIGTDLREIREHHHGDPFRNIAWKASAKRGQLMVREFEAEVRVPVFLALDVGPSMRQGTPGATALDDAVRAAATLSDSALAGLDPVGLVTFSARRLATVPLGSDPKQHARIEEVLLEAAANLAIEDVAGGRLGRLRAAAAFLAKESALRVRPDLGLPGDEMLVMELVSRSIEKLARRGDLSSAPDDEDERLSLYLHHHGLEPEVAPMHEWAAREVGLVAALEWAASQRARAATIFVLTDLRGVRDTTLLVRAVTRACVRARVGFVVFGDRTSHSELDRSLAALADDRERRAIAGALRRARASVSFVAAGGGLRDLVTRVGRTRETVRAVLT